MSAPPSALQPAPRRIRGLVPTDDPHWPWQAVDADPQFCFGSPPGRHGFRVTVRLQVEDGDPAPVVYTNLGQGYGPDQAVPMHTRGDGLWHAECRPRATCRGWRLDPLDRPGRFRLSDLQVEPLASIDWLARTGRQLGTTLERLRLRWRTADLEPDGDLRRAGPDDALPAGRGPGFVAEGRDPQWRLPGLLPAGWYMVELQVELPAARAIARLYPNVGQGEDEAVSLALPLRSGVLAKRLIHLPEPARLRIDPMAMRGALRLTHFRLHRVTTAFAHDRMARKLARQPRGTVADPAALWPAYDALFHRQEPAGMPYADWIREVEAPRCPDTATQQARSAGWTWQPRVSVLLPTWNTPPALLRACLDSVLAQGYPHWELCIADDASTQPAVREILTEYAAREPRIRIAWRAANGHIAEASNSALALASGEFVALLDHDDCLAPHALWQIVEALQRRPQAQLLYSDEDKIDDAGQRRDPHLKPDWMPDLLLAQNYLSHLGVYRRALVEAVGGFRRGYEGSQDHDLALRCIERIADPADIVHVPHVLYHWRMTAGSTALDRDAKDYASEAGRRAVQDHVDRCHPGVRVETVAPGLYRTHWPLPAQPPRVSLIIPTRDQHDLLRTCVESILQRTTYPDYELLVVDNQSSCPRTLAYLDEIAATPGGRVRVLRWDAPFNYSAINNFAATQAGGSVIGLVNNDIEVISPHWLDEMVAHALRPDIGCVGAKLHYPDRTIQHAGVVLGIGGIANHLMRGLPSTSPGPFGRLWTTWNPSAVTAATLLLRRAVWDAVGGLDAASLPVAFNDVDLCLKARALGLRNLWTPHAELIHHESVSRGADTSPAKRARFLGEVATMRQRWGALLDHDPAYHPDLTRLREDSSLAGPQEHVPHTAP